MNDLLHELRVPRSEMAKFAAAFKAANLIKSGMKIGLGTGSTAYWFVVLVARRIQNEGLEIEAVTTSTQTAELASVYNIPLSSLDQILNLDVVVDGADEIDTELNLIKGGGGALLQEKIVANTADRVVIIADESKYVEKLGEFHLPIEVVKFGWKSTCENIREMLIGNHIPLSKIELRKAGLAPFVTDEGHYIVDCYCEEINDPKGLAQQLNMVPGVVETGLFIGFADLVILGRQDGKVAILDREEGVAAFKDAGFPIDLEIEEGA